MRRCRYCEKEYPEDSFGVAATRLGKVYRRWKCRDCYRSSKQALARKHYEWLAELKSKYGCFRCGVNDPRVLDFHHRDKRDKLFGISALRREVGFKQLANEIAKCEVVCSNCHRILHDEEKRGVVYR